ncbi:hypothetical protein SLS62_008784 [Diatrype stigma]|uniref:Uncharacterized protein n=1 Tax=Diatrype stigma TaxID=117547 RepID=A0AAN9YMP2_9PEZI
MASQEHAGVSEKAGMEELEKGDVNSGTFDLDNKRMTRNILWKLDTRDSEVNIKDPVTDMLSPL